MHLIFRAGDPFLMFTALKLFGSHLTGTIEQPSYSK